MKHGKRVKLNLDTLSGPNGLPALKKLFENFKFKGDNHEKEDLTNIMQILQQWMCFRLFPKGSFEYNMAQLENLGNRKNVQTYMKKIRLGIDTWGEQTLISNDHQECDTANSHEEQLNQNNFDLWWQQEIANVESDNNLSSNEATEPQEENNDSITEQSVQSFPEVTLTPEQLERIAKNKKLAEERRLQRLMRENSTATSNLEELI